MQSHSGLNANNLWWQRKESNIGIVGWKKLIIKSQNKNVNVCCATCSTSELFTTTRPQQQAGLSLCVTGVSMQNPVSSTQSKVTQGCNRQLYLKAHRCCLFLVRIILFFCYCLKHVFRVCFCVHGCLFFFHFIACLMV